MKNTLILILAIGLSHITLAKPKHASLELKVEDIMSMGIFKSITITHTSSNKSYTEGPSFGEKECNFQNLPLGDYKLSCKTGFGKSYPYKGLIQIKKNKKYKLQISYSEIFNVKESINLNLFNATNKRVVIWVESRIKHSYHQKEILQFFLKGSNEVGGRFYHNPEIGESQTKSFAKQMPIAQARTLIHQFEVKAKAIGNDNTWTKSYSAAAIIIGNEMVVLHYSWAYNQESPFEELIKQLKF